MKWTKEEITYLTDNKEIYSTKELSIYLNRTAHAVKLKLYQLGYKVKTIPIYYITCNECTKKVKRPLNQIKKSNNNFCSSTCAAIYNNRYKTHGTRRSKLEDYLEKQLIILYPTIEIHFNRKDTINSELDIYIPSLKLAFELNGIFHYEPIFGENKLSKIENNDNRKFQACLERKIELCMLDTSKQKYFKETSSQEYLNIIINLINNKQADII